MKVRKQSEKMEKNVDKGKIMWYIEKELTKYGKEVADGALYIGGNSYDCSDL